MSSLVVYTGFRPAQPPCATPRPRAQPARPRAQRSVVVRAETDPTLILGVLAGIAGLGLGVGIPIFYESTQNREATRSNDKPCFPCFGTGAIECRFCKGTGSVEAFSGTAVDKQKCSNCEGKGSITCTTCQGSGIAPRYLDRREFVDDD